MIKILNFIPLLVWMLGYVFFACLDAHWIRKDGFTEVYTKPNEELKEEQIIELKILTEEFVYVCAVWLIIGIILSI